MRIAIHIEIDDNMSPDEIRQIVTKATKELCNDLKPIEAYVDIEHRNMCYVEPIVRR